MFVPQSLSRCVQAYHAKKRLCQVVKHSINERTGKSRVGIWSVITLFFAKL